MATIVEFRELFKGFRLVVAGFRRNLEDIEISQCNKHMKKAKFLPGVPIGTNLRLSIFSRSKQTRALASKQQRQLTTILPKYVEVFGKKNVVLISFEQVMTSRTPLQVISELTGLPQSDIRSLVAPDEARTHVSPYFLAVELVHVLAKMALARVDGEVASTLLREG